MVGPGRDLMDKVEATLRQVEEEVIRPRFRSLLESEVSTKSPGEVVTVADVEAERVLTRRLSDLAPAPVIGEEACADDPSLLRALEAERVWLIDPIDGTANFIAGTDDWAVMVALCQHGHTVASWIWRPVSQTMYVAERAAGATENGRRLGVASRERVPAAMRGAVLTRFLDPGTAARVARNRTRFGTVTGGSLCAGVDYPAIIGGQLDFALYWRTLPWDHAPGALLLAEAGGAVRRPDGTPYRPGRLGEGLLASVDAPAWEAVRAGLLGG